MEIINWDDPTLILSLKILALNAFGCWIFSVVNNNYSQVDRIWTLAPIAYTWIFTISQYMLSNDINYRSFLISGLVTIWGFRLTYNYYRKGGYKMGSEDYRWEQLQKKMNSTQFQIFNVLFISIYQNVLIYLFSFPSYIVAIKSNVSIGIYDQVLSFLFVLLVAFESIADQQQWEYQTEKYKSINLKVSLDEKYQRGFITSGLFRYSRHPNFFCEIMIWWVIYFFTIENWELINISIAGPILLTLLFQGSTHFTESITQEKYQGYKQYQKEVSRIIPWFFSQESLESKLNKIS